MAWNLPTETQEPTVAASDPITTHSPYASSPSRDKKYSQNDPAGQIQENGAAYTQPTAHYTYPVSHPTDAVSEILAGMGSSIVDTKGNHASTKPIDIPSPAIEDSQDFPTRLSPGPSSPLEDFMRNRRPSISFAPQVKLESGHRRGLEEPLSRLDLDTLSRSRPVAKDLNSPARSQSEADRRAYDSSTGQPLRYANMNGLSALRIRPPESRSKYPLLHHTVYGFPGDEDHTEYERGSSLTSESTASPLVSEAQTPKDLGIDTFVSPVTEFPPFHLPTSLEDSSAWPKPRRQASAARSKSYTLSRKESMRQAIRQGSRRSTSSSMSPATTFLSKFAREELPVQPDDEGQEVGEYVIGKQVGYGGFSTVKEAFTIEGGERICRAVKIVRKHVKGKDEMENERFQAEFEHEVGLWKLLGHRYILPLIAVHNNDYATFCFTRLNVGGTLFDLVRANRNGLSLDLARRYSYQLAAAIRYLHEDMRIVHRDIKLENCLIDLSEQKSVTEGGDLLLCDFGLADFVTNDMRDNSPDPYQQASEPINAPPPPLSSPLSNIGPSETSTNIAGSLQYASPELIQSPAGFLSPVVDMWAFGVVMYSIIAGGLPFQHMFQPRVQMMILAGEWSHESLQKGEGAKGMEDEALELVQGCLDMHSEARWTIGQVLESRWLAGCQERLEELSESWKL